MSKEIITPTTLDSLMSDILPVSAPEPAATAASIVPVTTPLAESDKADDTVPERPVTPAIPAESPLAYSAQEGLSGLISLSHLTSLLCDKEREQFIDRRRVKVELSADIAFVLRSLSSRHLPQGLILSAILRDYIARQFDGTHITQTPNAPM